jgi:rSAM/selenodomain-associated transferase 1
MKRPELILLASQPLAGRIKTRLQPVFSAEQAAEIAASMLRATAELAAQNWPGDVYLYAAPDADFPLFADLARDLHLHLASQVAGDPGQRRHAALRAGLARRSAAMIMVCDVPQCPGDTLEKAYDHLARGRNVLGPTMDGGYYLLGLQHDVPALFAGISWDSDRVLADTLARAVGAAVRFETLPTLRDVDTVEDLAAVAQDYAGLQRFVPGGGTAKRFHLVFKPPSGSG